MNVTAFGEILLRLSPQSHHERIAKTHTLKMAFAGAECNAVASLALLGHRGRFVTRLPEHMVGDAALNAVREFGVGTRFVRRGGKRVGTYFIEHGASLRPTRIIYDREHSAIAEAATDEFDWPAILAEQDWFIATGITPALSESCAAACLAATEEAHRQNVHVAFDLNFRRSLWDKEAAQRAITPMLPHINVLFSNIGSAADVFDIHPEQAIDDWDSLVAATEESAARVFELANFSYVALTVREHPSASENGWAGILYDGKQFYHSRKYHFQVIDRLGGGDAFMAGILHGLALKWDLSKTIEFATAASAIKHTIPGDINVASEAEILEVAEGNTSGRVKR
ncbi:MAG: sugar kinase [Tunicatimonas sp.]